MKSWTCFAYPVMKEKAAQAHLGETLSQFRDTLSLGEQEKVKEMLIHHQRRAILEHQPQLLRLLLDLDTPLYDASEHHDVILHCLSYQDSVLFEVAISYVSKQPCIQSVPQQVIDEWFLKSVMLHTTNGAFHLGPLALLECGLTPQNGDAISTLIKHEALHHKMQFHDYDASLSVTQWEQGLLKHLLQHALPSSTPNHSSIKRL